MAPFVIGAAMVTSDVVIGAVGGAAVLAAAKLGWDWRKKKQVATQPPTSVEARARADIENMVREIVKKTVSEMSARESVRT